MPEGRLLRTLRDFNAGVTGVLFLPQTKGLLATGSSDGILKLWDASNGQLVLSLYCSLPATDESGHSSTALHTNSSGPVPTWLVWTPQGYYDGSPDAESLIRWRVPRQSAHPDDKGETAGQRERQWELRPASQFQSILRRPDLIRAHLARYYGADEVDGNPADGAN